MRGRGVQDLVWVMMTAGSSSPCVRVSVCVCARGACCARRRGVRHAGVAYGGAARHAARHGGGKPCGGACRWGGVPVGQRSGGAAVRWAACRGACRWGWRGGGVPYMLWGCGPAAPGGAACRGACRWAAWRRRAGRSGVPWCVPVGAAWRVAFRRGGAGRRAVAVRVLDWVMSAGPSVAAPIHACKSGGCGACTRETG